MIPALPFWVLQRQVKTEQVSEDTLRLNAPNLPTYDIAVQPATDSQLWRAVLYRLADADGDKVLTAESDPPLPSRQSAWEAAFELYRQHVIV